MFIHLSIFIYPSANDKHLGGFHFLVIMNKAPWTFMFKLLCEHIFNSLDYVLGVEFLVPMLLLGLAL